MATKAKDWQKIAQGLERQVKALRDKKRELQAELQEERTMSQPTLKGAILKGSGTHKDPFYIQGFRNEEFTDMKAGFQICEREGIDFLRVAYSGRYYERRDDGWYEVGMTETCHKVHGIPKEGRKVS